MASLRDSVGSMVHCSPFGGQLVRVSAARRIIKAAEESGKIHVWGRVPVDTGDKGGRRGSHDRNRGSGRERGVMYKLTPNMYGDKQNLIKKGLSTRTVV